MSTQSMVPFTAASMLSESVTSTWKNFARDSPPSFFTSSAPFSSLRSSMEMLPPCWASSRAVARPRPEALMKSCQLEYGLQANNYSSHRLSFERADKV